MAKRRNIGGRYVETRERSTSKGGKGTIMGNWSSGKKETKEHSKNIVPWIFVVLVVLLILYLLSIYL